MMRRFSTGITPLDAQLGGGFPSGSVILLLEEPGAGAEVFSFHFALAGINRNEKVLYITTNDTKEQILENFRLYFALENGTADKIDIVDLVTPKLDSDSEATPDVKAFLKQVKYDPLRQVRLTISKSDHDRVILNNLAYFILNYNPEDVVELVNDMSLSAKKNDSVILVLMTKGITDEKLESRIKFVVDGIIELDIRESETEIQRRLKILKLKRVLVPKSILRYDLTDRGVRMESVMRVL
jgi:KaiC/GvpD/RAD55 family RecA-like ATPase